MAEATSRELVTRLAAGDQSALGALYDRYAGVVNALALRILRDAGDAEDVVQEVFVQVWRQACRFDSTRGTPEAWLFMIARSRALDRYRRRAAAPPSEPREPSIDAPQSPDGIAVRRALAELPGDQRKALELAYYEGLTQTEIAARLGQPLGTIKTRIRTAMIRLREVLGPAP